MVMVVIVVGVFFVWVLILDYYGGVCEYGYLGIFVGIMVFGCVFCFSYYLRVVVMICVIDVGLFLIYSFCNGLMVDVLVGVNIVLVVIVIFKVVGDFFFFFVMLERLC